MTLDSLPGCKDPLVRNPGRRTPVSSEDGRNDGKLFHETVNSSSFKEVLSPIRYKYKPRRHESFRIVYSIRVMTSLHDRGRKRVTLSSTEEENYLPRLVDTGTLLVSPPVRRFLGPSTRLLTYPVVS